jgi:hypothetical protein
VSALALEQQLGVHQDRRERILQVVGDDGGEPVQLGVRRSQLLVGLLKLRVESNLRPLRGQSLRDVEELVDAVHGRAVHVTHHRGAERDPHLPAVRLQEALLVLQPLHLSPYQPRDQRLVQSEVVGVRDVAGGEEA